MRLDGYEPILFIASLYLLYLIIKLGVIKGINNSFVGKYFKEKHGNEDDDFNLDDLRKIFDENGRKSDK